MVPASYPNTHALVHVVVHAVLAPDTTDQPIDVFSDDVMVPDDEILAADRAAAVPAPSSTLSALVPDRDIQVSCVADASVVVVKQYFPSLAAEKLLDAVPGATPLIVDAFGNNVMAAPSFRLRHAVPGERAPIKPSLAVEL